MSVFAIGDIHGCLTTLETLLAVVPITASDTLVLLGDYVDRGPDTKGVLDGIIRLGGETHTVALFGLFGNHEQMMVQARDDKDKLDDWLLSGGDATLASYGGGLEAVPAAHWNFLQHGCVDYWETPASFLSTRARTPKSR